MKHNGDATHLAFHHINPVVQGLRRGQPQTVIVPTQERADQWTDIIGRELGFVPSIFSVEVVTAEDIVNAH